MCSESIVLHSYAIVLSTYTCVTFSKLIHLNQSLKRLNMMRWPNCNKLEPICSIWNIYEPWIVPDRGDKNIFKLLPAIAWIQIALLSQEAEGLPNRSKQKEKNGNVSGTALQFRLLSCLPALNHLTRFNASRIQHSSKVTKELVASLYITSSQMVQQKSNICKYSVSEELQECFFEACVDCIDPWNYHDRWK